MQSLVYSTECFVVLLLLVLLPVVCGVFTANVVVGIPMRGIQQTAPAVAIRPRRSIRRFHVDCALAAAGIQLACTRTHSSARLGIQ